MRDHRRRAGLPAQDRGNEAQAALDGLYVIRTNLKREQLDANATEARR